MRKLTLIKSLEFVEDTGGAYKYQEIDSSGRPIRSDQDGATLRDFYIRKSSIPIPAAARGKITVTIEFET